MRINNPKINSSKKLLSEEWKGNSFSKGLFVRVLLQFILVMSFLIPASSVQSAPVITNTANASFSINGVSQILSDSIQFTKDTVVVPTDTLELVKISNVSTALTGSDISYTLSVNNPNPRILNNVTVEDNLPLGLVYISNSTTINGVTVNASEVSNVGNILSINIGSIPANSNINVTYVAKVSDVTPEGNALNRATATSDTATSPQATANVIISRPVVIEPTVPLILEKVADQTDVRVGETVKYTLTINNDNSRIIADAIVRDLLPTGLEYIVGSALLNNVAITASINTGITFNLGDLAANSSSSLTYDVLVKDDANNSRILVNNASVSATDTDANSNNASATVNVVDDELTITKSTISTGVSIDDIIDYSITLTNPLTRAITNIVVKDTMPTGFSYEAGTAFVNNDPIPSGDISINANTVEFELTSIVASSSIIINYKVKVNENAAPGDNVNTAQALSDFASSAEATATVRVRTPSVINFLKISDLGVNSIIQSTSFNTNTEGGKNFEEIDTIPLLDGSSITLPTPQPIIPANQYVLGEPVVIEVIDLDQNIDSTLLESIEVTVTIPGTNDTEILLLTETSPNSGVFRGIVLTTTDETQVQDGKLTIADGVRISVTYRDEEDSTDTSATAALVVPDTNLQLEKTADKDYSAVGELVRYTLAFRNTSGSALSNVQINDLLPAGFVYIQNSVELNGDRLISNVITNGRILTFNLNSMPAGSIWTLEYVTKISAGVKIGDAVNTAYFTSGSLRSNDAQAIVKIKDDLMRSKNILTGRVYIGCKTHTGKDKVLPKVLGEARVFMETGRSVLSDKEGFWHMEGVYPGAHVLQLDTESIPGYEPLLCEDNTRRAKDAKSYFVDLQAGSLWNVDFHVKPIKGYVAKELINDNNFEAIDPSEKYNKEYVNSIDEGFEILWPKNNYVPAVASTKIFIKSSPKDKVEVFLNDVKVNPLNYDGSNTNKDGTVVIRRWLGVDIDINKKNNTLVAVLKNKTGKEIARKSHNIHFSSKPASAELLDNHSILIADGKTTPIITLKIKDEEGFPMRANTHGYLTLGNNKYSIKTQNDDDTNNLNESISGSYKYKIKEGGIARIQLNPTTQSGQVKLNLQFNNTNSNKSKNEISAWLKPALREWIMVGIAEGTLAHTRISGTMKALDDLDINDGFSKRGRVAFFAKGKVQGKYLLTVAYDTHKNDREVGSQLNGNIDPDAFYTIYADNSNSQYNAPSSEKLYLKLEKENFYALFGDYQTNMSVTDLAKYQRTLNGIKTEYNGERLSYTGFISETSNNNHHEEIPGDGTSGLYQLSEEIIPNSETITIETRDRFRSDNIIESTVLTRYQDYNIDYDSGTLFFKEPINSKDANFNPIIIVVDYDSESDSNKSIVAGGRVALKSLNGKLETGASFIHEGQNDQSDNLLIATDLTYQITPDTEVRVEVAQSKTETSEYEKRNAYILELEKEIENMEAKIYAKKQESGFGINSQASENGTEKIGAELNYKFNKSTRMNSEVSVQKNLENDNKRHLAQVEFKHEYKQYQATMGYRHTQEELESDTNVTEKVDSNTLLLGAQYVTKNDKVTLRSNLEKNISSANGSEVSPDRLVFGVDVKLAKGFSVFAENETTDNGDTKSNNTRVGVSKELWKGAKGQTTYTQERTDEGQRNYATLGLSQSVNLTDKIKANFSIDKAKTLESVKSQNVFNEDEVTNSEDFTAFSVGLGSKNKDWSWTSRAEYRDSKSEDKINFLASAIRHYENGKNLSAKLSYYNTDNVNGNFDRDITLSFGSAWHPKEKDFVFFSRLDLVDSKSSSLIDDDDVNAFSSSDTNTKKIIHNMHYNRKINEKTRVGLHHGIKHVKDQNNGISSTTTVDTGTVEIRRDINKRWDIGVRGGYLHDWDVKAIDYVAGVSLGVNPTKNIWVELGYNLEGFTDDDFDNTDYTAQGAFINFRYKFNQDTIKDDIHTYRRKQQQK